MEQKQQIDYFHDPDSLRTIELKIIVDFFLWHLGQGNLCHRLTSRMASNEIHATFYKRHEVSVRTEAKLQYRLFTKSNAGNKGREVSS